MINKQSRFGLHLSAAMTRHFFEVRRQQQGAIE